MRKQVGFRVLNAVVGENGMDAQFLENRIRTETPFEDGWEVLGAEVPQVAAKSVAIFVFMVQYKDVPEVKASAK